MCNDDTNRTHNTLMLVHNWSPFSETKKKKKKDWQLVKGEHSCTHSITTQPKFIKKKQFVNYIMLISLLRFGTK